MGNSAGPHHFIEECVKFKVQVPEITARDDRKLLYIFGQRQNLLGQKKE